MQRNKRIIVYTGGVLILAFTVIFIAKKYNTLSQAPEPSDGDISSLSLLEDTNLLKIQYMGGGSDTITLTLNSLKPEIFRLNGFDGDAYLRFYSPAFYKSSGQPSQGIIILTRTNPSNLTSDPNNDIALEYQTVESPTTADLGFAVVYTYLQEHNMVEKGIPLCAQATGDDILSEVVASSCYISCNGESEVMARFLPGATRVVILGSRSQIMENGYIFLWSELHASVEVFENNKWYVADPSYGFAYVKDKTGERLSASELIEVLDKKNYNDLTFGLVYDGVIHDVPGEDVVKENTTLAGIYYTPDKILSYRLVKSNSFLFPSQLWISD